MLSDPRGCGENFWNIKLVSVDKLMHYLPDSANSLKQNLWKGWTVSFHSLGGLLILKLMGENGNASYFTANHFSRTAWFMHINSKLSPPKTERPDPFPDTVTFPSTHGLQSRKSDAQGWCLFCLTSTACAGRAGRWGMASGLYFLI